MALSSNSSVCWRSKAASTPSNQPSGPTGLRRRLSCSSAGSQGHRVAGSPSRGKNMSVQRRLHVLQKRPLPSRRRDRRMSVSVSGLFSVSHCNKCHGFCSGDSAVKGDNNKDESIQLCVLCVCACLNNQIFDLGLGGFNPWKRRKGFLVYGICPPVLTYRCLRAQLGLVCVCVCVNTVQHSSRFPSAPPTQKSKPKDQGSCCQKSY